MYIGVFSIDDPEQPRGPYRIGDPDQTAVGHIAFQFTRWARRDVLCDSKDASSSFFEKL